MKCDVVVIGGGAAGSSAAVVLARSLRRVVVIDAGEPRNRHAAHTHGFSVQTGRLARRTTGGGPRRGPRVRCRIHRCVGDGRDRKRRPIHCPARLRPGSEPANGAGGQRVTRRAARGGGRQLRTAGGRLLEITVACRQTIQREAVFVGPRFIPQDRLLEELGCDRAPNGWIAADPAGATTVEGVRAAGDVIDSPAQLLHAAAAGSRAAVAINHPLLDHEIDAALMATEKPS